MVTSANREEGTMICFHDDYCRQVEETEIADILLKLGNLISNAYHGTEQTGES